MARRAALQRLAHRLRAAAAANDWAAVAAVDGDIAATLPALAAQGHWSAAERQAWTQLQHLHAEVLAQCQTASTALADKLAGLRAGQEAWRAYALHDDSLEDRA